MKKMIPIREEYRITIPIVGERFIYQHSEVIFDDEGKPEKMVGIVQDITDSKILEESIVVSQEKYSSIFGKMKEGFAHYKIIYDELGEPVDFKILEMNDSYLEQTGLTRDLVIGNLFSEVMFDPKEDLKRLNSLQKIAQGGKSVEFEEFTKELNKWFLIIVFYTQKDHVATLSIDITERKEIERELTERDRLTKTSKEIALISEFEYTLATDEFHFSEEFYEIFGFSRYDMQKPLDDLFDLIHPEDREFVRKRYQLIIGGKPSKAYRFRIQLSDGSIKHVLQKAEVIFDENNKPEKIIGIIQNVTEQEELDLQFLQSEEQFREVMENAPVGVVITNLERELLRYNTKFVQLVGYETKEDFADNFISVENFYLNPKDRGKLYKILNENGIVENFDTIFKRRDDTTFWCSLTSKVHETISGEVLVYHIIEDISTLKEGQFALNERVKELSGLYGLSKILQDISGSLDESFNEILEIIPPAWQYPEITTARIIYNEKEYNLENFQKTKWFQSSNIVVDEEIVGTIEVYYLEEKPKSDEGPFLKEERELIDNFALDISSFLERRRAEEERNLSEEKLRSVMFTAPIGIAIVELEDLSITLNNAGLEMLGFETQVEFSEYPKDKLLVNIEDREKLYAQLEKGIVKDFEAYIRRKDGEIILCSASALYHTTENGEKLLICLIEDITEWKEAENELKSSEERFRSVFNYSNDGYLLNEPDGTILDVNPTLLNLLGYERDEVVGKNLEDFDYAVDHEADNRFAEAITKDGFSYIETHLKRKDGPIFPADLYARRIDIADKEVIFTVLRDLTKRKEAEIDLIESEEKYHTLFDKANDIILLVSYAKGLEKSYILETNEKATEIFGYTKEEFQTMTTTDLEIDEEVWKKGIIKIRKQIESEGFTTFERTLKCKNGKFIQAEISSHSITLKDERMNLAIIRDTTERKKAEED
ncbi:MAG: PAS domain S-box protein, partial [Candidatus Heimdallarchaeota archaeon]|nr:PAS domain S-box protein [Candidatus Heimdallarchaeota archaeon]MCK4955973.1 PAS domain S-box protein [Candidatus Heimdallarchaeota archaeon]